MGRSRWKEIHVKAWGGCRRKHEREGKREWRHGADEETDIKWGGVGRGRSLLVLKSETGSEEL